MFYPVSRRHACQLIVPEYWYNIIYHQWFQLSSQFCISNHTRTWDLGFHIKMEQMCCYESPGKTEHTSWKVPENSGKILTWVGAHLSSCLQQSTCYNFVIDIEIHFGLMVCHVPRYWTSLCVCPGGAETPAGHEEEETGDVKDADRVSEGKNVDDDAVQSRKWMNTQATTKYLWLSKQSCLFRLDFG